ncbi:MAG: hypothetical protein NT154_23345 [Verrucomicrobia bacterium]|nr:hypothetical protein [Verrucomicrobiota bacterium]
MLTNHACLVVDSRVPRSWFLNRPCTKCCPLERRQWLKTRFPTYFRPNPEAESLVGTRWVLVSRKDPDGLLERVLPGKKVAFGAVDLTCRADSGEVRGRRSWELDGVSAPFKMSIYDVHSATAYTGAALKLTRQKDQMILVPTVILKRSVDSVGWERYDAPATASYRLER